MSNIYLEAYFSEFWDRVKEGDIVERDHIVVPIKTGARIYGAIGRKFVTEHPDIEIPDIPFRNAKTVDIGDGKTATFVTYWDDESEYSENHIRTCISRSLRTWVRYIAEGAAMRMNTDEESTFVLCLPIFKGLERSKDVVINVETELQAIERCLDWFHYEYKAIYVTNNIGALPCL
tara:strand:- start:2929 stop:3456 length:528 start_codon:yes stop_codon:yes gene_type:complete